MIQWNAVGELISSFLTEAPSTAAEEAKRRGLVKGKQFGSWVDPSNPGKVLAKTVKGKLVAIKGAQDDAEKSPTKKPAARPIDKSPKKAAATPKARLGRKGAITSGGDSKIKQQLLDHGFVKGSKWSAPGNPGSAFNEVLTGEGLHLLRANPHLADDDKALTAAMTAKFGDTELAKQQGPSLRAKTLATARAAIDEFDRINESLTSNGIDPSKVKIQHYYGTQDSLAAMIKHVQQTAKAGKKIFSPTGDEIPADEMAHLIKISGGGENPQDTAIFAQLPNGNTVAFITSNKLNTNDQWANSTLRAEADFAQNAIGDLAKKESINPKSVQAANQLIEQTKNRIAEIEKNLPETVIEKMLEVALKDRTVRSKFLKNLTTPTDDKRAESGRRSNMRRWEHFKNKIGESNDTRATAKFFTMLERGQLPARGVLKSSDIGKLFERHLKGIPGVPTAQQVSAQSRGQVIDTLSQMRKSLNKIRTTSGQPLGNIIEAKNTIEKYHLGGALGDRSHGVNKFPNLFVVNAGGVRIDDKKLASCMGTNTSKDFMNKFNVSDPIPVKDEDGNITGAKFELYSLSEGGKQNSIGTRFVRSKGGAAGKLQTAYTWSRDMQNCFKGKTGKTEVVEGAIRGPGDKSGNGLARNGSIAQPDSGDQDSDMQKSPPQVQAQPPQAKSGKPNPDEDELEQDFLDIGNPKLMPKSPLGALVVKAFDQPIGDPDAKEKEKEKEEKDDKQEAPPQQPQQEAFDNTKNVPVYAKDRKTVLGHVGKGTTSVGAAKVGGSRTAELSRINGKLSWVVKEDYKGEEQTVKTPSGDPIEVDDSKFRKAQKTEPTMVQQMDEPFVVATKEGDAGGKKGDYLAQGVEGEEWPIDQQIFNDTHKFVGEGVTQTNSKKQWIDRVKKLGYKVEPDGTGKFIAHQDGEEKGTWDPKYGGAGFGYWYEAKGLAAPDFETEVELDEAIPPTTKWEVAIKVAKKLNGPRQKYALAFLNWKFNRPGNKIPIPPEEGLHPQAAKKIRRAMEQILSKEVHFEAKRSKRLIRNRKTMAADKARRDPVFRKQLKVARDTLKIDPAVPPSALGGMSNDEAKSTARKFLKRYGLKESDLGITEGGKSMQKTSGRVSYGAPGEKRSKGTGLKARRASKKRERKKGKEQASMQEGTILKVRPDLWASKNMIGEVRHFSGTKLAELFARSKSNLVEDVGGIWRRASQECPDHAVVGVTAVDVDVDEDKSLSSGGGTSSGSDRRGTFISKAELSPEELQKIDQNWKRILTFSVAAFKKKEHPVALRAIEGYLEKMGVDSKHSMKIADVISKKLGRDTDPVSMIIPKVIPRITQEPNVKGGGHFYGGHPGGFSGG